jgi:restriction system protein
MKRFSSLVPTFDEMLLPTVQALQMLGGSGTTEEIYDKVVQILNWEHLTFAISNYT